MTRPSPSQARAISFGIAIPIAVALITAAAKQYNATKLDAVRFERDSISTDYERRAIHRTLSGIDSTTRRIDERIDRLEDKVDVLVRPPR